MIINKHEKKNLHKIFRKIYFKTKIYWNEIKQNY